MRVKARQGKNLKPATYGVSPLSQFRIVGLISRG